MIRSIFLSTALLLFATLGMAKNIYVSTKGSDNNAGTIAAPYASIALAAAQTVPGDTVIIRGGTYRLTQQIALQSGAVGQYITYKSYPGENVLIDGDEGYCFTLQFKDYIAFRGLKMTTSSTKVGAGMIYMEGSNHCLFEYCEFYGMPAESGRENTAVIRCMGTENGYSNNCIFRNNYFYNNLSPALRLYDTKGWIISNNKFYNCLQAIGGKDNPYDMLVKHNLIIGSKDAAFYFPLQNGGKNVTITENIILDSNIAFIIGGLGTNGNMRENLNVHNNTIHNCTAFIHGWDDQYSTQFKFWNNIVHADVALNIGTGADMPARYLNMNRWNAQSSFNAQHYTFEHNCIHLAEDEKSLWIVAGNNNYFYDLASWQTASGLENNSIVDSPAFINSQEMDFQLHTDSKCKRAGKNGEDLGAYPRGSDGTVIGIMPHQLYHLAVSDNEQNANKNNYRVYPNPAFNQDIHIVGLGTPVSGIKVYNLSGALLYQGTETNSTHTIHNHVFKSKGIYIIAITANKQTHHHKLIIR